MIYKSYSDLAATIRNNIWKIPDDVDIIVGIPRSGMIPALFIAEYLNKKCVDIDAFIAGTEISTGGRGERFMRKGTPNKILVIDDSCCSGRAMGRAKLKLSGFYGKYTIIFGCVYLENPESKKFVDIFFEEIPSDITFYEWNILQHGGHMQLWDIDGVVCKDPPSDDNTEEYEKYLESAVPMIIPSQPIVGFVTYRLGKYWDVTERWLKRYGIKYHSMFMFKADNRESRNNSISPAQYKSYIYSKLPQAKLFIESEDFQASEICRLSNKPCYCYSTSKMYI